MSNFETWWEREGQEFLYALNTTTDDDIKLVAEVAWKNGAYCAEQAEQEPSKQQEAQQELKEWQRAYPLSVFPEPDCTKAQQALESVGMTLDSLSASTLRWALDRVMQIVEEALEQPNCQQLSTSTDNTEHQEPFDMNDHPPHRLCECRKCMEYFTPLPDCDAFAASGKPIAEQTNTQLMEGYRIGLAEMREKCAKVCEARYNSPDFNDEAIECADAIRARNVDSVNISQECVEKTPESVHVSQPYRYAGSFGE